MLFSRHTHNLELGTTGPLGLRRLHIPVKERATHMYVIGITGKGKSKFLEHMLFQDIVAGRGCGVLDPHGDLVDDLLCYLHSNPHQANAHWTRIVYLDPSDPDYVLPFNVLASSRPPYETAQHVVEAFRRTWPQALAEAPRFANIATAALLTLIANQRTLVDLPRLLTDAEFRDRLLTRVSDPELVAFWHGRFDRWGRETPLMVESILNKVTAFTLNPHLRLLLGAAENRLDFQRIMDNEQVLIVNLGHCDAETRRLVGSLIVTGLEQAARTRRHNRRPRAPFYFAIDEFQDFCANDGAAQSLAQILSECRKYGLHLTLAHQTLAQIGPRMQGALGNMQLKVAFGLARDDAEILARRLFQVDLSRIKHEVDDTVQQERSHPLFYSLPEEWEVRVQRLQNLAPRCALVARPQRVAVHQIKTATIRYRRGDAAPALRQWLARKVGRPRRELIQALKNDTMPISRNGPQRPILREPVAA